MNNKRNQQSNSLEQNTGKSNSGNSGNTGNNSNKSGKSNAGKTQGEHDHGTDNQ